MKLDSSFVSTAGLKRLETTPAIPFTLTKIPRCFTSPRHGGERRALGKPVDEPPLTPRPRKSLFSRESLLRGTRSPFMPAALPAKSVGIFPPTRTRLAGGPPIMSTHQPSPEGEGGTEDKTSGVRELHSQVGAEPCWGPDPGGPRMEVPPLTL